LLRVHFQTFADFGIPLCGHVLCNSFSYLSPRRQSSYASISGSGSFDDLGSTSSSSAGSGGGGCGGIAARFATLRATPRRSKDAGHDALSVKDEAADSRRHFINVRTIHILHMTRQPVACRTQA